jgi:hypothetical protein
LRKLRASSAEFRLDVAARGGILEPCGMSPVGRATCRMPADPNPARRRRALTLR